MQSKEHWERIYSPKPLDTVSWYQEHAEQSLRLIRQTGLPTSASIIDVGGGASTLVDDLLRAGYSSICVLDLSEAALSAVRRRLGEQASAVTWLAADIAQAKLHINSYDIWHDRAVFHFLTAEEDRHAYVAKVLRSVKPGGHVIVATFGEQGPQQCSGLPVVRYSPQGLHAEFGASFTLLKHEEEAHHTPSGTVQKFIYCYCRRAAAS